MNNEFDLQEKIEQYILGKLPFDEEVAFEEEISKDDDLRKKVEENRRIMMAFQRKGERKAFDAMRNISREEMEAIVKGGRKRHISSVSGNVAASPAPGKTRMFPFVASIAAVLMILIYIGIRPQYSSQELFDEYFRVETYTPTPSRGESPGVKEKEYTDLLNDAIHNFEEPDSYSIKLLTMLSASDDFEYQQEAEWYLTLFYLRSGQRDKASELLKNIVDENGEYADKAKELSDKLKERKWF